MPTTHTWFRPFIALVLTCFLMTGCYRHTLERGAFDPSDPKEYMVEIYLEDDQKVKGLFLAETAAYIILSVKDVPEANRSTRLTPTITL